MDLPYPLGGKERVVRVLLTGTYCSKNKGDATMQQVFESVLKTELPGAQVSIASPFPDLDAVHYKSMPVLRSRRRNLPLATIHWLVLEIMRLFRLRPQRYFPDAEVDAMIHADVVVDLSGDMLTEDYGVLVGFSHFLPLLQALALGRPLVICAQSIGPFHKLTPLAKWILSRSRLITIREKFSAGLISKLRGQAIRPIKTADLAFMLQSASEARTNAILVDEGIESANKLRLGVSVSALLANRTNRHLGAARQDKLVVFARALDRLIESTGTQVLLVSHVFGPKPSGDDRQVAVRLGERMRNPVQLIRGEYRPEELKGIIASCDVFVGCRMHANIAALDSCVPVLGIGYSHKTRGIMADLDLEEWVLPVEGLDVETLEAAIIRLIEQASDYRQQLSDRLPEIQRLSRKNIELVARMIESNEKAG